MSNDLYNDSFINLAIKYGNFYKEDGKSFMSAFLTCASIRSCCGSIVKVFKTTGIWKEVVESGKDFSDYANKQNLEEKWKPILAETLLIIWSILQPDTAETAATKEG